MTIGDKLSILDYCGDLVVDYAVEFLVVELLGYRWGQIVNRRDVHYVVLDFYEIYILVKVLLNLKRPEAFRITKIELVQNVR
jgi:hypothetical protein